jgi:ankyrin repeat protein
MKGDPIRTTDSARHSGLLRRIKAKFSRETRRSGGEYHIEQTAQRKEVENSRNTTLQKSTRSGTSAAEAAKRKSNKNTPTLFDAVYADDLAAVQQALHRNPDLEAKKSGMTALHVAALRGQEAIVQELLGKGASIESEDTNGRTALGWASYGGHQGAVELLLEKGASRQIKDKFGYTPQVLAQRNGHNAVSDVFQSMRKASSSSIASPLVLLHTAARCGKEDVVRQLLDSGEYINAIDQYGNTILLDAAFCGQPGVVRLLLARGADTEVKNTFGHTALCVAAGKHRDKIVEMLLAHRADRDKDGLYPKDLHDVGNWQVELAQELLRKGADVNAKDTNGDTPLHRAANGFKCTEMAELLLKYGADVNVFDGKGRTALHIAAMRGDEDLVTLLLDYGADAHRRTREGNTALRLAVNKGHRHVLENVFRQRGSRMPSPASLSTGSFVPTYDEAFLWD